MVVPSFTCFVPFTGVAIDEVVFSDAAGVIGGVPAVVTEGAATAVPGCDITGVTALSGTVDCVHPAENTRAAIRSAMILHIFFEDIVYSGRRD
jgi:hypothetical protein